MYWIYEIHQQGTDAEMARLAEGWEPFHVVFMPENQINPTAVLTAGKPAMVCVSALRKLYPSNGDKAYDSGNDCHGGCCRGGGEN